MDHTQEATLMSTGTTPEIELLARARAVLTDELRHLDLYELLTLGAIIQARRQAKEAWPEWPTDHVYAAAIVAAEAGELVQAVLNTAMKGSPAEHSYQEALQTAVTAIRFASNHTTELPR